MRLVFGVRQLALAFGYFYLVVRHKQFGTVAAVGCRQVVGRKHYGNGLLHFGLGFERHAYQGVERHASGFKTVTCLQYLVFGFIEFDFCHEQVLRVDKSRLNAFADSARQ